MKRVYCLYRVSSAAQVEENDIPMQRIACRSFAACREWEIVKEFSEKGISGYKISMDQRDAIAEIREAAILGKFDVLLVFMFDRIGRRDDETPFVVEWLVKHGIEIWSVCEGEQRFDNHVDKLMNYIRYWQAAGESERISERTRTRIRQLTSEGYFTGGVCPFGYHLVRMGRENKKKQPLYDLTVSPEEAAVVKYIFEKVAWSGCGTTILANDLNARGLYPKSGKPWNPASLSGILRNRLYLGELHKGDAVCRLEQLRIVEDELFNAVQEILAAKREVDRKRRAVPTCGRSLLSSFLFCAACGSHLSSTHIVKHYQRADGTVTISRTQKYVCQHRVDGRPCKCAGQHTYVAETLNQIVLAELAAHLAACWSKPPSALAEDRIGHRKDLLLTELQQLNGQIAALNDEMQILQKEMLACISGTSAFPAEQIRECYERDHAKLPALTKQREQLLRDLNELEHVALETEKVIQNRQSEWAEFPTAPLERQKLILSRFLRSVTVSSGYAVEIVFADVP